MGIENMYEEAANEGPTPEQLSAISILAERQVKCEIALEAAEMAVKKAKAALRDVQEKELPEAMSAAGCQSFKTTSGFAISIKEDISASLAEGKKDGAINWLKEHGHGAIVSTDVIVPFSSGEEEEAKQLLEWLVENGHVASAKTSVNTATLKALIRELERNGVEVPLETLGAFKWKKSVIVKS